MTNEKLLAAAVECSNAPKETLPNLRAATEVRFGHQILECAGRIDQLLLCGG